MTPEDKTPPPAEVGPEPEPATTISDGTTKPFVVIHTGPDGKPAAHRLHSTSKGNVISTILGRFANHTVNTIHEDVGATGLAHEGQTLKVEDLKD